MLSCFVSLVCVPVSVAVAQSGPLVHTEASAVFDVDATQTPFNATQDGPGGSVTVSEISEPVMPGILTDTVSAFSAGAATGSAVISVGDGYLDDSSIIARGTVSAAANRGAGWSAQGRGVFTLSSQFTVLEETIASLSGSLSIERPSTGFGDPDSTFAAFLQLSVFGVTPGPMPGVVAVNAVLGLDPSNDTEIDVFEVFDVAPGGTYTFLLSVTVVSTVDQDTQPTEDFTAEFDVSMFVGDRDGDGLLDSWETDGIDVDGDGSPEIDLASMGADPDRKDLFVEIDSHAGSAVPFAGLGMVVDAFANAPVANPSGPDGITLHLLYDESDLAQVQYEAFPEARVAAQKLERFGSPADRSHPLWENGLRDARLRVFRYCVWGGVIAGGYSGWAEIVGDDLIVALDDPGYVSLSERDRASVFMHELGHNLGLRHGGADDLHNKPNYLSVMNYMYIWPDVLPFYVNAALDYSADAFATLDEGALSENAGLGAPGAYANRYTFFNTAPGGGPVSLLYVGVTDPEVDWNDDGTIGGDPVAADLNRHRASDPPTPGQTLRGHDDWDAVRLPLAGGANFGFGASLGLTTSGASPEPTVADLLAAIDLHSGQGGPCPADFNGDGVLDFFDISAFLVAFNAQNPDADTNADGVFNFFDISAYMAGFIDGCP